MVTTALQYSGGRDSRALLHLHRDQLDKIIVVWMNPGDAYPDQLREMHRAARDVPHFLILHGNVVQNVKEFGYPSDVVPINFSPAGRAFVKKEDSFRIQSAFDCCARSMWLPLAKAMTLLGITRVIRGQRREEQYTNSAVTNGTVIDGVEYILPLEDWTTADVEKYLRDNHIKIPDYYATEGTSHDCVHCTAYLDSYQNRIRNLPDGPRNEVTRRLKEIAVAIEQESAPLKSLLAL